MRDEGLQAVERLSHRGRIVYMKKVERFEDLVAWQKARVLVRTIYRITSEGPFAKDFALFDQIRRAAISVPSNIAEGYERTRRREYHHFLCVAKASCAEVRTQLYIARDVGHITENRFRYLMEKAEEVGRLIGGLRAKIAKPRSFSSLIPHPSSLQTCS